MDQDDRRKEENKSPEASAPVISEVSTIERDGAECHDCQAEKPKKLPWHEKGRNLATIVAVVVASIALCLNQEALRLSRDGLDEARKANEVTARNFQRTERPWVGVTAVDWPPGTTSLATLPDMGPLPFKVTYRNLGRSPALNVIVYTEVTAAKTVEQFIADPRFVAIKGPPATLPVLGPGSDNAGFPYTEAGFNWVWRGAFQRGAIELIVFGFIEYADQFRDTEGLRGTLFCYVYKVDEPFPGFRLCPGHNLAY